MKTRSPIPKVGKRSKAWAKTRREVLPLLLERQEGRCAGCGRELPRCPDVHHAFGRGGSGACLGDEYADRPELLVLLDRTCHDELHRGDSIALGLQVRWDAYGRFVSKYEVPFETLTLDCADGPIVAMRQSIRRIEAREAARGGVAETSNPSSLATEAQLGDGDE